MKLIRLESGTELSAVVPLEPQANGTLVGIERGYDDTWYILADDAVDVAATLRQYFASKGWDRESVESAMKRVEKFLTAKA